MILKFILFSIYLWKLCSRFRYRNLNCIWFYNILVFTIFWCLQYFVWAFQPVFAQFLPCFCPVFAREDRKQWSINAFQKPPNVMLWFIQDHSIFNYLEIYYYQSMTSFLQNRIVATSNALPKKEKIWNHDEHFRFALLHGKYIRWSLKRTVSQIYILFRSSSPIHSIEHLHYSRWVLIYEYLIHYDWFIRLEFYFLILLHKLIPMVSLRRAVFFWFNWECA